MGIDGSNFNFGDIVIVAGYGDEFFKIEFYSKEEHVHPDFTEWTGIFTLRNINNGERIQALLDDMALVQTAETFAITGKVDLTSNVKAKPSKKHKVKESYDELLDKYNIYKYCREFLKDDGFVNEMNEVIEKLQQKAKEDKRKRKR